jgi:negative regulator of replication initiation
MIMPTIRIDNEVWNYLQSKATPFEDSPNDVLRREFGLGGSSSEVSRLENPRSRDGRILPADKDYTHHRVTGYRLNGLHISARTFRDVLVGVSGQLRREHLEIFDQAATGLQGKKRVYFSLNPSDLKHPLRVPDSNLFVETNLNANMIVGICRTLVQALGHEDGKFSIE